MDMTADYRAIIFTMKKKLCVNARIICVIYDLKYHEIFFYSSRHERIRKHVNANKSVKERGLKGFV